MARISPGEGRKRRTAIMHSTKIKRVKTVLWTLSLAVAGLVWLPFSASSQSRAGSPGWHQKDTEWASYSADVKGSRYRPLDQINASNFNKLEVAWRFKTDNLG